VNLTVAGVATTLTAVALLATGLATARFDIAAVGAMLAAVATWGWFARPTGVLRVERGDLERGQEPGRFATTVLIATPTGSDAVHVRLRASGFRDADVLLAPGEREVRATVHTARTGRAAVFGLDAIATGADSVTRSEPVTEGPVEVTLVPRALRLSDMPLPFRLQGMTGAHASPRIGTEGDFRDVNIFASGDRLRRIDWRVTARRSGRSADGSSRISDLYVRRTFAVADATVMLVIDSRDEVGSRVSSWSRGEIPRPDQSTSLDVAREAAVSVARQYLELGDRVGLEDLGRAQRSAEPAGGRRQLHRLAERLAIAHPAGEPLQRMRAPILPSGALVVLFSTFLDDQPARMAQLWRHAGHRVLAVDVLPELDPVGLSRLPRLALDLVRLERADRLIDLRTAGIETIRWVSAAAVDDPPPAMRLAAIARSGRRR
jgi:uncharacterized protein (DUF58 family)